MYKSVILGFTTIPDRVKSLDRMLQSVARQTRKPDIFILSVPKIFKRKNIPYPLDTLQTKMETVDGILNIVDEDYGPLTKLMGMHLYTLKNPCADALGITIDDDVELDPCFVENLLKRANDFPGEVVCYAGVCLYFVGSVPQISLQFTRELGLFNDILYLSDGFPVNIVCGYGGVAYPLGKISIDKDLEFVRKNNYVDKISRHDDLYISCWMHRLGIKKRVVRGPRFMTQALESASENALHANDGRVSMGSNVVHAVEWFQVNKNLMELGLLEQATWMPLHKNLTFLIPLTTLIIIVSTLKIRNNNKLH